MSKNKARLWALLIVVGLGLWTVFCYATLIAAFFATTGAVQVCLGIYIIGALVIFAATMVFRSKLNKQ